MNSVTFGARHWQAVSATLTIKNKIKSQTLLLKLKEKNM